jgi:sugar lactone lactonase YvrE
VKNLPNGAAIGAALCLSLSAATTATWEMGSYNDFLRGKLTGLSLNRDGKLALAPRLDSIYDSEQPQVWAVARGNDGSLYLGTGHRGRVFRFEPGSRKSTLLWTSDQPEVFALAVDAKGVVYAASSPDGKIYRIENGKATEYFADAGRYVWALAIGPDGALYAGAGEPGRIYRITAAGKGEVYFDSQQSHITCLAFDSQGRLLAGSEPNGILYRIAAKDKAFVLFDANLPEIRSLLPMPDGSIYVAALGGSLAKRGGTPGVISGLPSGQMVTAPGTSITVTDSQAGLDVKPKAQEPRPVVTSTLSATSPASVQAYEVAGVEKSAIFKVFPDNTVENVWSSKDENVYDLAQAEGALLFATDGLGRVYRLNPDRRATLILQTNEGETSRLLASAEGVFATSGSAGRIYRLAAALSPKGEFEAPVHDAGAVARWGRLHWRADIPKGARVEFRTRSGNSSRPDSTWSDWSEPLSDLENSNIKSPNARFLQWKLEIRGAGDESPVVHSVTAAYLPQNNAPAVRSVTVATVAPSAAKVTPAASNAEASFSITVTDSGEAAAPAGTATTALSKSGGSQQTQITWQADDPEADRLIYSIYFRGEDEREWKLLRSNTYENSLLLDGDILADGRYLFRVIASDRPANPMQYAREAEGLSAPVLIDNTPPVVRIAGMRRDADRLEIDIEALDATSMLRRCEYSLDAASWQPLEAADGVTDSLREKFELRLDKLRTGEHLVVIRVYDQAGNVGLTKAVVR